MTTFEHALLGVNGLLATGMHRKHGWKLVALAGFAAIAPDWDGLPMLVDMAKFEQGHRVWGHNLFSCLLLGMLLGICDYRLDLSGRIAARLVRLGPFRELEPNIQRRQKFDSRVMLVWVVVAFAAALSQIPADAVVSGAEGMSDWALKPLWPFSRFEFIYPLVPWGNVGVTLIFSIGMIAQIKKPGSQQSLAIITLIAVVTYILLWGTLVN